VNLGFAEGDADAQEGAFAVGIDAHCQKHGTVEQLAVLADFFVAGIQHEIGKATQRAFAPFFEFGVEELGAFTDLGGTDGSAAEFLDNGGDFAGGNALDIHFCEGEFEGLFGAQAFLEGAGVKGYIAADLGDVELDGAEAGGEGFVLEAIGIAEAGLGALVRSGLEDLGTFDPHGLVDEQAEAFGEAGGALIGDELQNGVQEFRIGGVGHVRFGVGCVCCTPTGNPSGPPSTSFFVRGTALPLRGSAALGSLRSPSLRLTPEGQGGMNEAQFTERNLHRQIHT